LEGSALLRDRQSNRGIYRKRADRGHVATVPADISEAPRHMNLSLNIECFAARPPSETIAMPAVQV
jgi:hypothetical protein